MHLVLAAALAVPAPQAPTASTFDDGLEAVHRMMEASEWGDARNALQSLLRDHPDRDTARARRATIVEDLRRCAFWIDHEEPDWASLVSGKLDFFSARSGKVSLTYRPETLDDFDLARELDPSSRAPADRIIHPMTFDGSYTVEIDGDALPAAPERQQATLTTWVCLTRDEGYAIVFGIAPASDEPGTPYVPGAILHVVGGEATRVTEIETPPCTPGEGYRLEVRVGPSQITVSYNGRAYMRADKSRELHGAIGFDSLKSFDRVVLKGTAQTSWLRGLRDTAVREEWDRFLRANPEPPGLPEWLTAKAESGPEARPTETEGADESASEAGDETGDEAPAETADETDEELDETDAFTEYVRLREEVSSEAALAYARSLDPAEVGETLANYMQALACYDLALWSESLELCERNRELDPAYLETRIVRAMVLPHVRRRDDAIAELRSLISARPDSHLLYPEFAKLLLTAGRPEEARRIVDQAHVAGVESEHLATVESILVKAVRGPEWPRVFRYESNHYVVTSDIDRETCHDAANVLEETLRELQQRLHASDTASERFRVNLFSGSTSYRAYAREVFSHPAESTTGLYSPSLKQLLAWGQPEREDTLRTLRHEGFHQYLDTLMELPPTWFNEGLAVYYETPASERRDLDQAHPGHVAVLSRPSTRWVPLEQLLYMSPERFYANADVHYAQSWALIWHLRHSTRQNEQLFQRLFEALLENRPADEIQREVFEGVDLATLEREVRERVVALQ